MATAADDSQATPPTNPDRHSITTESRSGGVWRTLRAASTGCDRTSSEDFLRIQAIKTRAGGRIRPQAGNSHNEPVVGWLAVNKAVALQVGQAAIHPIGGVYEQTSQHCLVGSYGYIDDFAGGASRSRNYLRR